MIYVVTKFWHYILGSQFVFFVDHTTLVNRVNKPQLSRRIVWWILLLSNFDYEVVCKPRKVHVILNTLNHLESGEPPTGISVWLPNKTLLEVDEVELEPHGLPMARVGRVTLEDGAVLTKYVVLGEFPKGWEQEYRIYTQKAMPYTIIEDTLYW